MEAEERDVNQHEAGVGVAAAVAHVAAAGNGHGFEVGNVARRRREHPVSNIEQGAQSPTLECAHYISLRHHTYMTSANSR